MTPRSGLTLMEVVLGAVIVGCAALPVLELIRSSTVSLEITEIETAARGLGADVLEQFAGRTMVPSLAMPGSTGSMQGVERRWDEVLEENPALKKAYPKAELAPLLNLAEVKVAMTLESPSPHPVLASGPGLDWYEVRVTWKAHDGSRKGVTFGRFVDM